MPLLFSLRRDPFERAQHNSNTYEEWLLERPFISFGTIALVAEFLTTLAEHPLSHAPGTYTPDTIEKQIRKMSTSEQQAVTRPFISGS